MQNDQGDLHEIPDEQKTVMLKQIEMGIEVYVIRCEQYPKAMTLVDSEATIAWVATTDDSQVISSVIATSYPPDVSVYRDAVIGQLRPAVRIKPKHFEKSN